MYNITREQKLLNLALKYRNELSKDNFNAIISFCYGIMAEKEINNSIEKYIEPMYNKIVKRATEFNAKQQK